MGKDGRFAVQRFGELRGLSEAFVALATMPPVRPIVADSPWGGRFIRAYSVQDGQMRLELHSLSTFKPVDAPVRLPRPDASGVVAAPARE